MLTNFIRFYKKVFLHLIYCASATIIFAQQPESFTLSDSAVFPIIKIDNNGNLHCSWIKHSGGSNWHGIYYCIFDTVGTEIIPPYKISNSTTAISHHFDCGSSNLIFAWEGGLFTYNSYIKGRFLNLNGDTLSGVIRYDDPAGDYYRWSPRVSYLSDTTAIVIWKAEGPVYDGIYGQLIDSNLNFDGNDLLLSEDVTTDQYPPSNPRIGSNRTDSTFIITWIDDRTGVPKVYYRLFTNDGTPLDSSHLVSEIPELTYSWGHDVIVNSTGQVIICYTAEINNSHWNVYLRVLNPDGSFVGPSTAINDYPALGAATVELAIDEADWGVIVWEGIDTGTNTSHVAAQRFSSDINLLGNNFIVTLLTEGDGIVYSAPTLDIGNGNIYTTWTTPESLIKMNIIDFNNPPVEIDKNRNNILGDFSLAQNFPNPFNPTTTISYELPQRSDVQITIYDLLGRKVTNLVRETQDAGYRSIQWNASTVPSGMYFYQIVAGDFTQTRKMVVLK